MSDTVNDEVLAVQNRLQRGRVEGLHEAVYYACGAELTGDVVEFGTMTGETARGMALAMLAVQRQYGVPLKHVYLYDSFIGLPKPDRGPDLDLPHVRLGRWASGGCNGLSDEDLTAKVVEVLSRECFTTVAGWYSDTVPGIAATRRLC